MFPRTTRKVVMDVDTGVDDALAIFLGANSPELDIQAITTVAGNVSLDKVVRNTLNVARLAGLGDVPVYRGLAAPIESKAPQDASHVHGIDGLGNSNLPEPTKRPAEGFAPDIICDLAKRLGQDLTIVTTGPLSNLATAARKDPGMMRGVGLHVMMGGAFSLTPYGHGNMTPAAEFNVWHDPEAARVVFRGGLPTVAVGLDVTTDPTALLREEHLRRLDSRGESGGLVQKLARAILESGGGQLHDPMAVAYAISSDIFKTESFDVDVEVSGTLTRGETVADRRGRGRSVLRHTIPEGKAKVCTEVDGERFLRLFLERLADVSGSP